MMKIETLQLFKFSLLLYDIAEEENIDLNIPFITDLMRDRYGIEIMDQYGYITHRYVIIDERKHLLFKIKYGV